MTVIHLTEEIVKEITQIGLHRWPREACGVLLPTPYQGSQVLELPNRCVTNAEYRILGSDIRLVLEPWLKEQSEPVGSNLIIWHTHPQGNVGPSRGDMRAKVEGVTYLVVALRENGEGIPTWF